MGWSAVRVARAEKLVRLGGGVRSEILRSCQKHDDSVTTSSIRPYLQFDNFSNSPTSTCSFSSLENSNDIKCLLLRQCIDSDGSTRTKSDDCNALYGRHSEKYELRSSYRTRRRPEVTAVRGYVP